MLRLVPVAAALGAEVEGVDLREPIDDTTLAELKEALLETTGARKMERTIARDRPR